MNTLDRIVISLAMLVVVYAFGRVVLGVWFDP
jgi:hypothetical protein